MHVKVRTGCSSRSSGTMVQCFAELTAVEVRCGLMTERELACFVLLKCFWSLLILLVATLARATLSLPSIIGGRALAVVGSIIPS